MIDILLISPEITKGMKSIGSKCLLPLRKNLTVIEYQISQLQKIKPSKITINIGFDADKIQHILSRYKTINFLINKDYEHTNQSSNLLSYIHMYRPVSLLVINNGILLKNNPISKRILKGECKLFLLNKQKNNFDIGCSKMDHIEYLFYDMPQPWSEIVYLNKEAIDLLATCDQEQFKQLYLFETINFLLGKKIKFNKTCINKSQITKIHNIKDLNTAKIFI
jgi:CTP:phosphocholine cytidylyltransferase-like protein